MTDQTQHERLKEEAQSREETEVSPSDVQEGDILVLRSISKQDDYLEVLGVEEADDPIDDIEVTVRSELGRHGVLDEYFDGTKTQRYREDETVIICR
jgi:hypothetical protein